MKFEEVLLSLGSNVGNTTQYMKNALEKLGNFVEISKVSSFYKTRPIGPNSGDNYFCNAIALTKTELEPQVLLEKCLCLEEELGRSRERKKNSPRTIDVDILTYGNHIINAENLIIPHKEMVNRLFVLKPLNEIYPEFNHPVTGEKVAELLEAIILEKGDEGVEKIEV